MIGQKDVKETPPDMFYDGVGGVNMTNYLVTCVIEGDNNISKEVVADSPKDAIDKVAVQYGSADLFIFEEGYKTEFVKVSKIIKFVAVDLDEKDKVDKEKSKKTLEALKTFSF